MSREPDGLDEFEDAPLVRALRAPGTPEELADEARFVAAYRRSRRSPARGGRVIGRIGVGGAALLAAVTLTGGVAAAAYTQRLPHSVQAIAHDAFGGVGVPPERAPAPPMTAPTPPAAPGPGPTASEQSGEQSGERPGEQPAPESTRSPRGDDRVSPTVESSVDTATSGDATEPTPTDPAGSTPASPGTPTDTGSPDASPSTPSTGTPGPPTTIPTNVSVSTSVRRVVTGGQASVTGLVLDDSGPVAGEQVELLQRLGTGRWTRVAAAATGADGTATFATGTLVENAFFRIRVDVDTDGDDEADRVLQSRKRRIGVQPVLTLSTTGPVVSVHALGAAPGDAFTVSRRATDGRLVRMGIRQLDEQGNATVDLSSYTGRVRVQVRVLRTSTHTAVKRWVTVRVPREPKAPQTPTPTPSSSPSPSAEPTGSAGRSTTTGS